MNIQSWAILGSRSCREKNPNCHKYAAFEVIFLWFHEQINNLNLFQKYPSGRTEKLHAVLIQDSRMRTSDTHASFCSLTFRRLLFLFGQLTIEVVLLLQTSELADSVIITAKSCLNP